MDGSSDATDEGPNRRAARFGHIPALDGLRAMAVLAVMAYHGGLADDVPGGLFSLDTFFCLSGFLITSLVVTEFRRTASVGLRAFWARRARRLLPALLLLLLAVAVWAHLFAGASQAPELRLDELSTLFYVANWHFIAVGSNYFVQNGPPSPLLHTWSLAVEEQFYLVWPVVALVILRRSRTLWPLLWTAVIGAVASAVEMALLYQPTNPTRVYFGTDTHAQSLLIGAALAVALVLWRERGGDTTASLPARRALAVTGLVAAAVTGWMWTSVAFSDPFAFEGGVAVAALATALVILAASLAPTNPVARVLALRPLRFVGRISYALYLWHYPFDLWLTHANTGLIGLPLLGVRTAVTFVVATASTLLVEEPIRQGRFFTALRAWVAGPAAVAVTVGVVVVGTTVPAVAAPTAADRLPPWPPTPTGPPVRVLLVGDSVALTLGIGLSEQERRADVVIRDDGLLGCGVAVGNEVEVHGQIDAVAGPGPDGTGAAGTCRVNPGPHGLSWPAYWAEQIAVFHPDLVVLVAGRWETVNRTTPTGQWTNILQPAYAAYIERQLQLAVAVGTAQGAHMILETSPCFDTGEQPDGLPWPEDNPARVAVYNHLVEAVAADHPATVTVQHLHALVCPDGRFTSTEDGVPLRTADGIHFTYLTQPNAGAVLGPELLPLWYRLGHAVAVTRAKSAATRP
jgi:peptidoglycan/LPS O-acetylase OafA/YrhL